MISKIDSNKKDMIITQVFIDGPQRVNKQTVGPVIRSFLGVSKVKEASNESNKKQIGLVP